MNRIEIDLRYLPIDVRKWIDFEVKNSNANDIKVNILRLKQVKMDNVRVSGYFCSNTDTLFVAGLADDWLSIMAHETCHRDQYTEQVPLWNKKIELDGEKHDPLNIMHEWLDGIIELKPRKLKEVLRACLNIELDCEIRAAKKINKFYLPINLKEYIQKANAYVYFYLSLEYTRKWYPKNKSPFYLPEVWTKMPTHFDNDYNKLPTKIKNLILQNSYGFV